MSVLKVLYKSTLRGVDAVCHGIGAADPRTVHVGVNSIEHLVGLQLGGLPGKLSCIIHNLPALCIQLLGEKNVLASKKLCRAHAEEKQKWKRCLY